MTRIKYDFDFNTGVKILEPHLLRTSDRSWNLKMGQLFADSGLSSIAAPYYRLSELRPVNPCEDREGGGVVLELRNNDYLRQLSNNYGKMLQAAYENNGKAVSVDGVSAQVKICRHGNSGVDTVVELWVHGTINDGHAMGVQPFTECFVYEASLRREENPTGATEFGTEEERIPDVGERSMSSPVYLVQAQNVKSAFGVTVKDNPERIYVMARWAGWSSVKFYGGQVLLIADITVR
ncbi:hypothetical protein BIZ83_gp095 [Erwinia phage vB_EamM_ChrisDB]|uniref:hypothetical protein n=1 Tax=Erwinia phage vB_EamM_ChrisDB TaxID=1883371 RepID=UPI00081CE9CF|nr:hypothetical protein BIZ83_gp095 [Erwinia phage vB_EamM_ChrisDB]ANZ48758.1 hypothetical protein CHRISDB_196 [Erwinia phage vB_EamM_ChrisDB]